ncbi:MAG: NAD-dependent epimerase/dehydratase family protein [Ktedonobacterales bacterium]
MRVLVIGGTSFIGPAIVTQLHEQGHEVTVFHRGRTEHDLPDGIRHLHGSLADLADFSQEFSRLAPDAAIHMLLGTPAEAKQAVDIFRGITSRLVVASSADVYQAYGRVRGLEGGPPDTTPLTEDAPLRTRFYPYRGLGMDEDDYDKILVERIVMHADDLPATVVRFAFVYGPHDPQRRLERYVQRMAARRPVILLDATSAEWRRSRVYAANAARAMVVAATAPHAAGRVYHVGEPNAYSEYEWVERVARLMCWFGQIRVLPSDQLPAPLRLQLDGRQPIILDSTRIRQELGYTELVTEQDALLQSIAWELQQPLETTTYPETTTYEDEDRVISSLEA